MNAVQTELTEEQILAMAEAIKVKKTEGLKAKREAYDALKYSLVSDSVAKAQEFQSKLMEFQKEVMDNMVSFREMMQEYGELSKKSKGGYAIKSEDDSQRLTLKVRNLGEFDERADLAEQHFREFFERTLKPVDVNTFDMMMKLLERKKGRLEYSRVMQILSFEDRYTDSDFKTGCKLLKESFQNTGSKYYLEFETKNEKGEWLPIILNFSSL